MFGEFWLEATFVRICPLEIRNDWRFLGRHTCNKSNEAWGVVVVPGAQNVTKPMKHQRQEHPCMCLPISEKPKFAFRYRFIYYLYTRYTFSGEGRFCHLEGQNFHFDTIFTLKRKMLCRNGNVSVFLGRWLLICFFLLAACSKSHHVAGKDHLFHPEGQNIHFRYNLLY